MFLWYHIKKKKKGRRKNQRQRDTCIVIQKAFRAYACTCVCVCVYIILCVCVHLERVCAAFQFAEICNVWHYQSTGRGKKPRDRELNVRNALDYKRRTMR